MLTRMSSDGEIPPMPTPTYGKILGLADKAFGCQRADLLGPNFAKHAQHWTKHLQAYSGIREANPFKKGGFFRVVGSLGRWVVVFSSCESHSFELLAVSCKFQEVVADHDIFSCIFRRSKVQSVSSHHTSMCKRLPCW